VETAQGRAAATTAAAAGLPLLTVISALKGAPGRMRPEDGKGVQQDTLRYTSKE
jgi:hypothetical protein